MTEIAKNCMNSGGRNFCHSFCIDLSNALHSSLFFQQSEFGKSAVAFIIFKNIPNSSIHIGINSIDEIALQPNEIVGRIPNKNVDIIKVSTASFLLKKVLDNILLCFDILVFTAYLLFICSYK